MARRGTKTPAGGGPPKAKAGGAAAPPSKPSRVHNVVADHIYRDGVGNSPFSSRHPGSLQDAGIGGGLTFDALDRLSRVSVVAAIHGTRIGQLAESCEYQVTPYEPGWAVAMRDPKATMTPAAERRAYEIAKVVMAAGTQWGHGNFEATIKALTRSSLRYDWAMVEVLEDRRGVPTGFRAIDSRYFRYARPTASDVTARRYYPDATEPELVEIDDNGIVLQGFEHGALLPWVRRPRADYRVGLYGYPELDEMLDTLDSLVSAEAFNRQQFQHGVQARQLLVFLSTMAPEVFEDMTRSLHAYLAGYRNSWKLPTVQLDPSLKEDLKSVQLGPNNRDMEFGKWLDYNFRLPFAIYQMDPIEAGYPMGLENKASGLNQDSGAARFTESRKRGSRPMLRSLAQVISTGIVQRLDEDFVFRFTGYDAPSDKERFDMACKAVSTFKPLNVVLAEYDLPRIDHWAADLPLNATLINAVMADRAQDAEPAPGEGGEAVEGDPGFDDVDAGGDMTPDNGDGQLRNARVDDLPSGPVNRDIVRDGLRAAAEQLVKGLDHMERRGQLSRPRRPAGGGAAPTGVAVPAGQADATGARRWAFEVAA